MKIRININININVEIYMFIKINIKLNIVVITDISFKKHKQNLEKDRKEKIYNNSSFYFRALNYLIWKENSN